MYKAPRGTGDLLPQEQAYWGYVLQKAADIARQYGYQRIDTPMFEDTRLFSRSIGEGTDIVEKEMYTFQDKGGDSLTLRPEGTAPVCRAYMEHGMSSLPQPVRLYYFAQVFRYERPQAGRFRQHHQVGFEAIGDGSPLVDVELIEMAWRFLESLGLRGLTLHINSIGDGDCRPKFVAALRDYYADRVHDLCGDCRQRLERNPLRLLDCKKESCFPLGEGAPRSTDYLCPPCNEHFASLRSYLTTLGLPFNINNRLVRGLDYYTRTVFEIQPPEEGAQSTVAGGGRYDGLIQELGGKPTPGSGFATGIERIILNLKRQGIAPPEAPPPEVLFAYVSDVTKKKAVQLASLARRSGITALMAGGSRSLKSQLRQANAWNARYAIIVGENPSSGISLTVKEMTTGEQWEEVPEQEFSALLKRIHGELK